MQHPEAVDAPSPEPHQLRRTAGALILSVALLATSTWAGPGTVDPVQGRVPGDAVLDVCVEVFDPGFGGRSAESREERGIFTDLRESEARFIAYRLREVLESTGNWGAVRVVPEGQGLGEVMLSGMILESSGSELAVRIRVQDATGRIWFDKRLRHTADSRVYEQAPPPPSGPFRNLYHKIANRMVKSRLKLKERQVANIRDIARLRFAARLAPEIFKPYLKVDKKGRHKILRLPANDDPMIARIDRIKQSDDLFVDVVDQHYANFRERMADTYDQWRADSYQSEQAVRKARRKARMARILGGFLSAGAVAMEVRSLQKARSADDESNAGVIEHDIAKGAALGAYLAFDAAAGADQEKRMYRLDVRELAASIDTVVDPVLVEIDGKTLRLTGSREGQFAEWRGLLQRVWAEETGLQRGPDVEPVWLLAAE